MEENNNFTMDDIKIGDLVVINCLFYTLSKYGFLNLMSGGLVARPNMFDENMSFRYGNHEYKITAHYKKTWQKEELKHCPFCGGGLKLLLRDGTWKVFCHTLDCIYDIDTGYIGKARNKAIKALNRRI